MANILDKNSLVRLSGRNPSTVVLVGNGAIENGWDPVRAVLDRWIDRDQSTPASVNALRKRTSEVFHYLAVLSYKFRFSKAEQFMAWKKGQNFSDSEAKGLNKLITEFLALRDEIAKEYSSSSGGLCLRSSPEITKLIGSTPAYLTTNWDETLWNDSAIRDIAQFHGRCSFPDSLVFPTELLVEDTAYDLPTDLFSNPPPCSPAFRDQVCSAFRYTAMTALFVHALGAARDWLLKCERLIIWGYALGDYDADVNAVLATFLRPCLKELVVINIETSAFHRAVALTGCKNARHFNPRTKQIAAFEE